MQLTGKSVYSPESHRMLSGSRSHGPIRSISERIRNLYWNSDSLAAFLCSPRFPFRRRLTFGCCQAHSNRNALMLFGNPCTINTIFHGPLLLVLFAPPACVPLLCCAIRRFGSTVYPM